MPILTPSYLPPAPGLASHSPSCASSNATCHSPPRSQVPTPLTSPEQEATTQRSDVPLKRERSLKVPSVKLDVPAIQEDMAASLAVALLGHVLFLKSQVPLCVVPSFIILSLSHLLLNLFLCFFLANFFLFFFNKVPLRSLDVSRAHPPHQHRARPGNART